MGRNSELRQAGQSLVKGGGISQQNGRSRFVNLLSFFFLCRSTTTIRGVVAIVAFALGAAGNGRGKALTIQLEASIKRMDRK